MTTLKVITIFCWKWFVSRIFTWCVNQRVTWQEGCPCDSPLIGLLRCLDLPNTLSEAELEMSRLLSLSLSLSFFFLFFFKVFKAPHLTDFLLHLAYYLLQSPYFSCLFYAGILNASKLGGGSCFTRSVEWLRDCLSVIFSNLMNEPWLLLRKTILLFSRIGDYAKEKLGIAFKVF